MKNLTHLGFALLLFSFALSISASRAQALEWIKSTGDSPGIPSNISITCTTVDELGNIYVAGTFEGSFDADFGPTNFTLESVDENLETFLIKLDNDGNFIWVRSIQPSIGTSSQSQPNDIISTDLASIDPAI